MPRIQSLLQRDFASYARGRRRPPHVHRAARSIMRCRTAALGGHVMACRADHVAGVWYNSCRHRACPQCAKLQIDRWLEGWRQRLLPCDHYHVIFTIPHELLGLWQANRKRLSDHLFRASRDTLFELLDDDRYLGARPGLLAALHTWGRTLTLHPHVRCLVTGGGRAPDGSWRAARGGFLLPVRVVRALFRGKLLAWLRSDLEDDRLVLPDGVSKAELERALRRLYSKTWNVRLQQRYAHGHGVVAYLARYVRGGPIRDRRLVSATPTTTTFSYTDHRDVRTKRMALPSEEFLRRLFWHVPEPRSHGVRLYGIYGRRQQAVCEACRAILPDSTTTSASKARRRGSEDPEHPGIRGRICSISDEPLASIVDVMSERSDSLRTLLRQRLKSP